MRTKNIASRGVFCKSSRRHRRHPPRASAHGVIRQVLTETQVVTHQWDVGGDDDFDTSITGGQYFFTYNLEDA
jgi:hypothetical protein